jgi:hypothetical protein
MGGKRADGADGSRGGITPRATVSCAPPSSVDAPRGLGSGPTVPLAALDEAAFAPSRPSTPSLLRRFTIAGDEVPQLPARRSVSGPVAAMLAGAALVAIALGRGLVLRTMLPIVLALLAVAVLLGRRARVRAERAALPPPPPAREIVVRGHTVAFSREGAEQTLIDVGSGCGTTLFTNRRRDRVILAVTSRTETLFVAACLDSAEKRSHAALLARASVIDGDEALDAIGPDGRPLELRVTELAALADSLASLEPGAGDRILLSDGRGRPLSLEASTLRVGEQRFDLDAPIEWRGFIFQEPFGASITVYQATSIRQGASSVVLVALVPSISADPSPPESLGIPELDRAIVRDLRLTHAGPGEPPPVDQRFAIDRMFVLPMRAALERASRLSSGAGSTPPQA